MCSIDAVTCDAGFCYLYRICVSCNDLCICKNILFLFTYFIQKIEHFIFASDDEDAEEEEDVDLRDSVSDGSEEEDGDDADDDDEEEEDDDAEEEGDASSASDEEESDLDSDEDSDSGPDLARGKGNIETSSDEDDEDDVEAILRQEEDEIEHDWGELCKDAPRSDEVRWRPVMVKEVFRSFTSVNVPIKHCINTQLQVKLLHSEFYLNKSR